MQPRPRTAFVAFLIEQMSVSSKISILQGSHQNGCEFNYLIFGVRLILFSVSHKAAKPTSPEKNYATSTSSFQFLAKIGKMLFPSRKREGKSEIIIVECSIFVVVPIVKAGCIQNDCPDSRAAKSLHFGKLSDRLNL